MRTGRTSWPSHPSTSISTACPTCAATWHASSPRRRSRNERSPLRVRRDRGTRRHPAIAPDGGDARGGPDRPREFHPRGWRGRGDPGMDDPADDRTGAKGLLGNHPRVRPFLRNHQVHPQRPPGTSRCDLRQGLEGLRGRERPELRTSPAGAGGGGRRGRPRPPARVPDQAVRTSEGEVDLARPHRHQPSVPARLEGAADIRGKVRRKHLLDGRVRPASPAPPVPGSAEHRPVEREEPGSGPGGTFRRKGGIRPRPGPAAHKTINALQRLADIILQKSTREGFGLTVTEWMWKGEPVIGGDVGGIRLQVVNHHTGFLVNTPEGAAHRIRYFLHHRNRIKEMGEVAREFVRENFLLTRHLRDYLTLFLTIRSGRNGRILYV